MGYQEIKDVAGLGIGIIELGYSASDGVDLGDIFSVVGVLKKIKPAVDAVKGGKLLDQYAGLNENDKLELSRWFNEEFDIADDKIEVVIEQGWTAILALSELAQLLKPVPA